MSHWRDIPACKQGMVLQGQRAAYLAAGMTVMVWSSAFTGIAMGLESFPAPEMALLRFLVASICLAGIAFRQRISLPERRDLPRIFALSFIGITVYHLALSYGQTVVSAGTAALIIATVPIWVALISVLCKFIRLSLTAIAAVFVAFFGVALIVLSHGGDVDFTWGASLIFVAAISTSILFVFQPPLAQKYGSINWVIYSVWLGTLPMLIFLPGLLATLPTASPRSILAVVYVGTLPIFCYITWSYAIVRLSATVTTSLLNMNPVLALLTAWLVLGEVPKPVAVLGGAIAIVGVFLLNFSVNPQQDRSPQAKTVE